MTEYPVIFLIHAEAAVPEAPTGQVPYAVLQVLLELHQKPAAMKFTAFTFCLFLRLLYLLLDPVVVKMVVRHAMLDEMCIRDRMYSASASGK